MKTLIQRVIISRVCFDYDIGSEHATRNAVFINGLLRDACVIVLRVSLKSALS